MKIELDDEDVQRIAGAVAEHMAGLRSRDRAPLMGVSEVAELLNCSPDTVRHYADEGAIPSVRFGASGERRFPREELFAAIDGQVKASELLSAGRKR